jgi:cytochrome b subunit of formate dehydrogenase
MENVSFGIGQLKEKTPAFVHWVITTGATALTVFAGLQLLYPQYINDHFIAEFGKALAAAKILGQFFGVTEPVNKPQDESIK